jgi:hypothetical protein
MASVPIPRTLRTCRAVERRTSIFAPLIEIASRFLARKICVCLDKISAALDASEQELSVPVFLLGYRRWWRVREANKQKKTGDQNGVALEAFRS